MMDLDQFLKSDKSLTVYHGSEIVFESSASDLRGLTEYLDMPRPMVGAVIIFDRYVGRAAAALMLLAKAERVFAGTISEAGAAELNDRGIDFESGRTVKHLMGVASDGMCRWEKMALEYTPQQLLEQLRRIYRSGDE
jgi:hypothetical protein